LEGITAVVEQKDKDQGAGLELVESSILSGHQASKTHIKSIAVNVHQDVRVEMPHRKFTDIFRHKEVGVRYVLPADECFHDNKGKIKTCQEHDISEQMRINPYQTGSSCWQGQPLHLNSHLWKRSPDHKS
jgi:hypothetical protein